MHSTGTRLSILVTVFVFATGAPAAQAWTDMPSQANRVASAQSERTLSIAVRVEPASIAAKPTRSTFVNVKTSTRLFNAGLDLVDNRNSARPYLAEQLPQLNTDSWQVFPDGKMETRYQLKPNLTWHDGASLTADDFVFAWQVYATPDLGTAASAPISAIEEVLAPDDRTLVIRWARTYPFAGVLQSGNVPEFPALPRHILNDLYQQAQWDSLANAPYWTSEFIGAGPYRLDRWVPGTSIEGSAFEGHVLGRARIDRVRIHFISDSNTALATLLSGGTQLATDNALGFEQGLTAKQQLAPSGGGQMLVTTDLWRAIYPQFRSDLAKPAALSDVRVRRALAHVIDKQGLNDVIYGGQGILADTILPPGVDYSATVDRAITHYPYDPRRAEQIMTEAGFARGSGGLFSKPGEERPVIELKTNASVQYEGERSIVAAGWRQAGFDVQEATLPAAQAQDGQARATFPGFYAFSTNLGERALQNFTTREIPRPENRWTGSNRGGWTSPEYDRLLGVLNSTLDRTERIQQISQLAKLLTDELPGFSLYYDLGAVAHSSALQGPGSVSPDTTGLIAWNAAEWELR